jgi:RNA 3'-terminal phosphate cyclase (ATP)
MCHGRLGGGQQRSCRVSLAPGRLLCGQYLADTGTAGSCTLMVQQALPCMLFATTAVPATPDTLLAGNSSGGAAAAPAAQAAQRWSQLDLRGGTDAAFAPPVGYLEHVLLPTLQRLLPASIELDVRLQRRGFYPRGGGKVVARARALAPGEALPPLDITQRGKVG